MKILKYEKTGSGKYRIILDNGEVIDTYDQVILKDDLLLKSELTPNQYQQIFIENRFTEAYRLCVKYVAIRTRSTKEIKDYLIRKGFSEDEIEEVIKRLSRDKVLDDEHFTECFIKDKLSFTSMGQYRIIAELKKHNITNEMIDKYSYLWDKEVMIKRIDKLVNKQMKSSRKLDQYKLRNKIYYYLLNLGYYSDDIVTVLNYKF